MKKRTGWFLFYVKPVHKGVYITRFVGRRTVGFSFWNGRRWGHEYRNIEKASQCLRRGYQHKEWRGLAEKPE